MQDEDKLETLKLFLEERFRDLFVSENEFHLDKLDQSQKRALLEFLEGV